MMGKKDYGVAFAARGGMVQIFLTPKYASMD